MRWMPHRALVHYVVLDSPHHALGLEELGVVQPRPPVLGEVGRAARADDGEAQVLAAGAAFIEGPVDNARHITWQPRV